MLAIGDAKLTMLNGGNFRLDGGAMHGVVPKTLWSKLVSCDALNRCEYTTRCLVVEAAGKRVLVETGNGDKFSPKLKDIYGIEHDRSIEHALREVGLAPDDIDVVVLTHMHFDHSGGTTRFSTTGSGLAPVFKRARHVVQRKEWKDAVKPHERNRGSYLQENIAPLAEGGGERLWIVDGETEIVPGVRVIPTPGHTKLPWVMGYDMDPAGSLETKRALFTRPVQEDWLLLWGHDKDHAGGRLGVDKEGTFVIRELVSAL